MKFSAQQSLVSALVGKVAPFLVKGSGPHDPGQYMQLEATKGGLSAKVIRPEVTAIATIFPQATEGLLKIGKVGNCVVGGKFAAGYFDLCKNETLDVETLHNEKPKEGKGKDTDDEVEAPPDSLYNLHVTCSGAKGRRDRMDIACLDIRLDASIVPDESSMVDFPAKSLSKYGSMISIAVGNSGMQADYSLVMLRAQDKVAQLVTLNGAQLAVAEVPEDTGSKAKYIMSYSVFAIMARTLDADANVQAFKSTDGARGRVIFRQSIKHDGKNVGELLVSIPLSEKFIQFDDKIKALDAKCSFMVNKPDFVRFCNKFALFDIVRTTVTYDNKQSAIVAKKCDQGASAELSMDVDGGSGPSIELDISSRHIQLAAAAVSGDEEIKDLKLVFSGKRSLAFIEMGKDIRQYFAPFQDA